MNPLYNAAIKLYAGAVRVASLSSVKARHMLKGQAGTMERLAGFRRDYAPDGFDVWFHAASLGEFEQARPLIDRLKAGNPDTKILVSFFSPSGYEVRCNYPGVAVVYLPFDSPSSVKSFLDIAKPRMAVFVKYEFWGNYLSELERRGIDTYIISAIFRPGQIFFRNTGGTMFRRMLGKFKRLYVQDERSRLLLKGIGIENVTVAGDTRFDRVTEVRANARELPDIDCFMSAQPDAFTLVAGSSWPKDEEMYFPWLKAHPDVRAIIAPHEFDTDRLSDLHRSLGHEESMLLSEFKRMYSDSPEYALKRAKSLRYLIIDCFGLLSSLYRYADAAYVGGGFGVSIHNINEAAVYGIPVVFGPNHKKFNEAAALIGCGAAFCVHSKDETAKILDNLHDDRSSCIRAGAAADNYIRSNIGASDIIMKDLFNIKPKHTPLND